MKKVLLILIFFSGTTLRAQPEPDLEKLSKACELWGLIKYFHPDKPGREFDSAFASQVPKMLEAKTDEDWKNVFGNWLSVLNDPATRIIASQNQIAGTLKSEFMGDSILYVQVVGTSHFDDFVGFGEFIKKVADQVTKTDKVIFDLRQPNELPKQYMGSLNFFFDFYGLTKILATNDPVQYKSLYYSGFKPETGTTSGGYSVNNIVNAASDPGNFEESGKRIVWIINRNSDLPVVSISQQLIGKAIIMNEREGVVQHLPVTQTFDFSGSLAIKFRTADLLVSGNQLPKPFLYSATDNPVTVAVSLLENEKRFPEVANQRSVRSPGKPESSEYPTGYPSLGYRVLAAAKMFSVIEMFFPYHEFMDNDWRASLKQSLPEFIAAKNEVEYGLAVAKMYANINDSHGFIRGNKGLNQLRGEAPPPIAVDWIEDKITITRFRSDSVCNLLNLRVGDVVTKVNGVPVDELMKKYEVYFAHSNKATIKPMAARFCVRGGQDQTGVFTIEDRYGKSRDVKMVWSSAYDKKFTIRYKLDTIQLINKSIGYADLTRMTGDQTDRMFELFKDTKAIIFDMRGYPNGTAWTIAPRLTEKQNVPLAKFRKNELLAPNIPSGEILSNKSYTEFVQTVSSSDKWKYKGKTVMLIDQNAQSQSEHTGLFFESVNNTTFIGSQTAGANGDVTNFTIPGDITLYFSGQGVWHADGRQLQRVGLVPHVPVKPTIKGIRLDKDEVLDKAIEWINANVK